MTSNIKVEAMASISYLLSTKSLLEKQLSSLRATQQNLYLSQIIIKNHTAFTCIGIV